MNIELPGASANSSGVTVTRLVAQDFYAEATVEVTAGSRTESRAVVFAYHDKMTMEQLKTSALKTAKDELDRMAAVLGSEVSNREALAS